MSKVSDSYDSLNRGVSQQAPHDRIPGQHWEQVNMISDPVRGLSRRHGSRWCDEMLLGVDLTQAVLDDLAARSEDTLFLHGVEYGMFRRDGKVPASPAPPVVFVNKDARKFVKVNLTEEATLIASEGISSVCTAGQYILLASAKRPVTMQVDNNVTPTAGWHAIWLRGGAYSRTFRITATTPDGVETVYEYTTMKSYYDKPLDTSDIPHLDPANPTNPNPNYNKLVNDRSNAYNSAVNKHIADAAKDITPENLATKLAEKIKADYPDTEVVGPYITIKTDRVTFSADDGGNGEFIRCVSRDVTSPELVTPKHFPGKVVVVQPKAAGSLPYYMEAVSSTGATGFTEVTWKETAGQKVTPTFLFALGVMHNGELYIAHSPDALQAMTGLEVPVYEQSRCGDTKTRQLPEFVGRTLSHMRMFQDRLMLISGSTTFLSRTGDYFNLFTESMLAIRDDDPIEVFAQGSEDDTITAGVQMDRNLVLFGRRFQYVVPGRESMNPRNAYIGIAAAYEGANLAAPATGGSLMFFCQKRERRLTMQQMQPGSVADRLEAFDISAQLDGYLTGMPQQIVAQTSPSAVFVKTRELRNGFYVYSFLDSNDQSERLFDSWSRWEMSTALGTLVGITSDDSGLLAVTARRGTEDTVLVLDRFSRETDLSDLPYLDSARKGKAGTLRGEDAYSVFDNTSERFLLGTESNGAQDLLKRFPDAADALWTGCLFDSYVVLTSPYLRDNKDRVILDAKLTVTKLTVSLSYSAAMVADISTDGGSTYRQSANWIARPVGAWKLNTQLVEAQKTIPVPVMKDNKTYRTRLSARNWLPMTVGVVEWGGQAFTSRR